MDNQPAKPPLHPELEPLMDAEFELAGAKTVGRLTDLHSTLIERTGVVSVEFIAGRLAVRYNPEEITGADIREVIHQVGLEVAAADSAPSAPPIESSESSQRMEDPER